MKISLTYDDIEDLADKATINVMAEDGTEFDEDGWDWDYEALVELLEGGEIIDQGKTFSYEGPPLVLCDAGKDGSCEACRDETFPDRATHTVTITAPVEAAEANTPLTLCPSAAALTAEAYIGFGWAVAVDHTDYGTQLLQKESTS